MAVQSATWAILSPGKRMTQRSAEFEALVERYGKLMNSAVRKVCARKHASLVPDVEQEVKVALWRHLERGGRIEHPAAMTHQSAEGSPLEVPDDLVRLSVGIESVDDLVADLTAAFDRL